MSSSHSAYSAFSEVDDLVSKPVLGSDGAASWQDFKKSQSKSSSRSYSSAGTAPNLPVKRSDRLGTGFRTIDDERRREEDVRREAGDAPLGAGYTEFKRRGPDSEEVAAKKRARLIEERVRPDGVPYFLRSETFEGWKEDYVFTTRDRGTGYYWDGMDSVKKQLGQTVGGGAVGGDDAGEEGKDVSEKKKRRRRKRKDKVGAAEDAPAVVDDSSNPMEQIAAAMRRRNEAMLRPPGSFNTVPAATGTADDDAARRLAAGGWETAAEPSSGRTYFFHRGTGERRWADPLGGGDSGGRTAAAAATVSSTGGNVVRSEAEVKTGAARGDSLPEGWKSAKDPGSGKVYYHHSSGKTSWEKPTA